MSTEGEKSHSQLNSLCCGESSVFLSLNEMMNTCVSWDTNETMDGVVKWSSWGNPCTAHALHAHCALLLDYVPPEEPLGTPLGNALRIR